MKVHIGVETDSDLIHSVVTTAANVQDLNLAAELLHGEEDFVYGDAEVTPFIGPGAMRVGGHAAAA
jgi:IS5 family transposase